MHPSEKANPWALLPLGLFIVLYLGGSLLAQNFYQIPMVVALGVASAVALAMNRGRKLSDKITDFCTGMGHPNVMLMSLIFILAGAFTGLCRGIGAIEAMVNLSLSALPATYLVAGLFVCACLIALAVGTSVGTITVLAPIATSLAGSLGLPLGLVLGAVVGGAMFGDNLSLISDTTIVATRSQCCSVKAKMMANIRLVLPAALLTIVLYVFLTWDNLAVLPTSTPPEWLKVMPYLGVLVLALCGVNVLLVLGLGIVQAAVLGIYGGHFDVFGMLKAISQGFGGMLELVMICLLTSGIFTLAKRDGGLAFLIDHLTRRVHTTRAAELAIAALVSVVDFCTANNTIAILLTGDITKQLATKYRIDPARAASLLDTFACFAQGIIPYGAQTLVAVASAGYLVSPLSLMPYQFYPILMGLSALGVILFQKKRTTLIDQPTESPISS